MDGIDRKICELVQADAKRPTASIAEAVGLPLSTAADRLKALMRKPAADLVMSDMAAPATGHTRTDHLRIMGLAEAAAEFAGEVLRQGGAFLCKVLQGGTERELLDRLKREFTTVRHVKPPASRADSSELYVLATGFRGGNAKS